MTTDKKPSPKWWIFWIGFVLLIHSVISIVHEKYHTVDRFDTVPIDILIESVIGLSLSLLGAVFSIGTLFDISSSASTSQQTLEMMETRPEFAVFKTRAKYFPTKIFRPVAADQSVSGKHKTN